MTFATLQKTLVAHLQGLIRNGEFTERGLARASGISQPHLHNVLKGVRALSVPVSDRLMAAAGLSLSDIIKIAIPGGNLEIGSPGANELVSVRQLDGLIGPDYPWPRVLSRDAPAYIPASVASLAVEPVLARAGPDPDMEDTLISGEWMLLDQGIMARREIRADGLYLVSRNGHGLIRRVREIGHTVFLITDRFVERPAHWEAVSLASMELSHIVRARVRLLGVFEQWEKN